MSESNDAKPPWLTAAFDQQDAAIREVRNNNRARFEQMTRRSGVSEDKVREAMTWFDAQRTHYDAAVTIHAAGPGGMPQDVPQPPPERTPVSDTKGTARSDEVPVQRHETTHVYRTRFEADSQLERSVPGRANRLVRLPAVYMKSFVIGAGIGGAVWLVLSGLMVWLLDAGWWGWWPNLLTIPIAAAVFLGWCFTVQRDINYWIRCGGREPLQARPRYW